MRERKTYLRATRVTQSADRLISKICDICNDDKYNAKINGDEDINGSVLLGFLFEKIVHAPRSKEEVLTDVLYNIFQIKDAHGIQMPLEKITELSREIIDGYQS